MESRYELRWRNVLLLKEGGGVGFQTKFAPRALLLVLFFVGLTTPSAAQIPGNFDGPTGIAICGPHAWVTNVSGNSVTELDVHTGAPIRILRRGSSGFSEPMGIATNGTDVWVANLAGDSITELNCVTGELVRNITSGTLNAPVAVATGASKVWVTNQEHQNDSAGNIVPNSSSVMAYGTRLGSLQNDIVGTNINGFDGSSGVDVSRNKVWITNATGNSVTELDANSGMVVRVLQSDVGQFKWPMAITSDGAHIWVGNLYGNSITEIDETTGSVIRVIKGDGLNGPNSIFVLNGQIWVTNLFGNSVTVLNSRNGAKVRVLYSDGLSAPTGITGRGTTIWVTNQWKNSVTEIVAANGSLLRVIY